MEKEDKMNKKTNETVPTYANINEAFVKLIGYITIIKNLKSYEESHHEYESLLSTIIKWAINYEINRDLSLVNHEEILDVYNKLDDLQTKYICNDKMGEESELSDYAVNWIWFLMVLRKNYIEGMEKK